jgi:hypothetical protein
MTPKISFEMTSLALRRQVEIARLAGFCRARI